MLIFTQLIEHGRTRVSTAKIPPRMYVETLDITYYVHIETSDL